MTLKPKRKKLEVKVCFNNSDFETSLAEYFKTCCQSASSLLKEAIIPFYGFECLPRDNIAFRDFCIKSAMTLYARANTILLIAGVSPCDLPISVLSSYHSSDKSINGVKFVEPNGVEQC